MDVLFKPEEGENIFSTYPELRDYPEFAALKPRQMAFVWHYVNAKGANTERAYNAYVAVYGDTANQTMREYVDGNFPFTIKDAVRVMEKFSLPHRMRAKAMVEQMFVNLETISKIQLPEDLQKNFDEQKKYADSCKAVTALLPTLLTQIEQGFGVRAEEEKDDGKKKPSYADNLMSELNN